MLYNSLNSYTSYSINIINYKRDVVASGFAGDY